VVAKIDMDEVRAPFIKMGILAMSVAFIFIGVGAWLFRRIVHPMFRRIEESEERLKLAAEGTHDGLWLWDVETDHNWYSPRFKELLGYDKDDSFPEALSTWESRIHPDDKEHVFALLKQHLENNVTYDCEHRLLMKSGEYRWFRTRGVAERDDSGKPMRMGGSIQDIQDIKVAEEDLKRANEELESISLHDSLTGIANRRMFDRTIDVEWSRAQRAKKPLSLLFIDIDFFKQYNDHYGHQMGDYCLKTVAQTLEGVARRSSDMVARYGGEEFVILMPETNQEQALRQAEACRKKILEQNISHEASTAGDIVTISVGVCAMQVSSTVQPSSIIEAADKAQYEAKKKGRNRVEVF